MRENDVADRMRERMKMCADLRKEKESLVKELRRLKERASNLELEMVQGEERVADANAQVANATFEAKAATCRLNAADAVMKMQEKELCGNFNDPEKYQSLLRLWRTKVFEVLVMHHSTESEKADGL